MRHVKLLLASSDTKTKQMTADVVYTVPLAHSCSSMNASQLLFLYLAFLQLQHWE